MTDTDRIQMLRFLRFALPDTAETREVLDDVLYEREAAFDLESEIDTFEPIEVEPTQAEIDAWWAGPVAA